MFGLWRHLRVGDDEARAARPLAPPRGAAALTVPAAQADDPPSAEHSVAARNAPKYGDLVNVDFPQEQEYKHHQSNWQPYQRQDFRDPTDLDRWRMACLTMDPFRFWTLRVLAYFAMLYFTSTFDPWINQAAIAQNVDPARIYSPLTIVCISIFVLFYLFPKFDTWFGRPLARIVIGRGPVRPADLLCELQNDSWRSNAAAIVEFLALVRRILMLNVFFGALVVALYYKILGQSETAILAIVVGGACGWLFGRVTRLLPQRRPRKECYPNPLDPPFIRARELNCQRAVWIGNGQVQFGCGRKGLSVDHHGGYLLLMRWDKIRAVYDNEHPDDVPKNHPHRAEIIRSVIGIVSTKWARKSLRVRLEPTNPGDQPDELVIPKRFFGTQPGEVKWKDFLDHCWTYKFDPREGADGKSAGSRDIDGPVHHRVPPMPLRRHPPSTPTISRFLSGSHLC